MKRNLYVWALRSIAFSPCSQLGPTCWRKAVVQPPTEHRRRSSKWTRCGRSRCRTTGSWATSSAYRWTRRITSGSFTARVRSRRWKITASPILPAPSGRRASWNRNAAIPRRRCWSSMKRAICWRAGAARTATVTCGRSRITASRWTTRATSGSAATAAPRRLRMPAGAGRGAAGRGRGAAPGAAAAGQAPPEEQSGTARGRGPGGPPLYHDSMIMKFTQDGKFLMQIGKSGAEQGQQRYREPGTCPPRFSSIPRPTKCTSPTATATSA